MSDVRTYSKHFITEFIDLYKSLPALWMIKSKAYSNRHMKNDAYNKMVALLKQVEPDADRDMVIKKINSLRSSHRKEKKKITNSLMTGSNNEDVYVPSLWYYDQLQFVIDQEAPQIPASSFGHSFSQNNDITDHLPSPHVTKFDDNPSVTRSTSSSPPLNQRRRDVEFDSVVSAVAKRFCKARTEDQHDIFGQCIASKLRSLPNDQRIYLEKIINDATVEAELGNLSRDFTVHVSKLTHHNGSQ